MWEIESSISWAIQKLDQLSLTPARKLELAQTYAIMNWIGPAMRELLQHPLTAASDTEICQIGFRGFIILAKAKETLERHRKSLAAHPPALEIQPSPTCSLVAHHKCTDAWRAFWWKRIARVLLHPTNPLAFGQVIRFITDSPHPDNLNQACKECMIAHMRESGGLEMEEQIFQGAVNSMESYVRIHKGVQS